MLEVGGVAVQRLHQQHDYCYQPGYWTQDFLLNFLLTDLVERMLVSTLSSLVVRENA